ncbi:MAG TPA: daunorubicin C-13 ketoreductase [Cytophagales bacterium]|jgi:NAD(P)-dependent dehydrogenase (short-subunit alcohol dehydrogenase family)|nr:daunorubicin C-13 ketoreductase [Cytophagales bacterium]
MSKIFITGSADGLGQMASKLLIMQGHEVVIHARNANRAKDALTKIPSAASVLTADLSSIDETKLLAEKVNQLGVFDAVIHNVGVYQASAKEIFVVNTIAPYILTCLIQKPKRLIYLSSGMHLHGRPNLEHVKQNTDRISYSDSKLHIMMMTLAVARHWPGVYCNAVDPGWVPTKMGGRNAPDDLQKGYETQAWLAVSSDKQTQVSGRYFFHQKERSYNPMADDGPSQEKLIDQLSVITGASLPKEN